MEASSKVFWLAYGRPRLHQAMVEFNEAVVGCACLACHVAGRWQEDGDSEPSPGACTFVPTFEQLMEERGVRFNRGGDDGECDLYTVGRCDWVTWGFGERMLRLQDTDDQQIARYQNLITDMLGQGAEQMALAEARIGGAPGPDPLLV